MLATVVYNSYLISCLSRHHQPHLTSALFGPIVGNIGQPKNLLRVQSCYC